MPINKTIRPKFVKTDASVSIVRRVKKKSVNRTALVYHVVRKLYDRYQQPVTTKEVWEKITQDGISISRMHTAMALNLLSGLNKQVPYRDELTKVGRSAYIPNMEGTIRVGSSIMARTVGYDSGVTRATLIK